MNKTKLLEKFFDFIKDKTKLSSLYVNEFIKSKNKKSNMRLDVEDIVRWLLIFKEKESLSEKDCENLLDELCNIFELSEQSFYVKNLDCNLLKTEFIFSYDLIKRLKKEANK